MLTAVVLRETVRTYRRTTGSLSCLALFLVLVCTSPIFAQDSAPPQPSPEAAQPKLSVLPQELADFAAESIFLTPAASPPLVLLPDGVEEKVSNAEQWVILLEDIAVLGGLPLSQPGDVPAADSQLHVLPAVLAGPGDTPAETPIQPELWNRRVPLVEVQENVAWGDVDHSIGVSLMQLGLYAEAERHLQRCLTHRAEHLGDDHVLTVASRFALERLRQRRSLRR